MSETEGQIPEQWVGVKVEYTVRISLDDLRDFWCARMRRRASEFNRFRAARYVSDFMQHHAAADFEVAMEEARAEMERRRKPKGGAHE